MRCLLVLTLFCLGWGATTALQAEINLGGKTRMPEHDLAEKKENAYLTGLPLVNYSSDFGTGLGARLYLYQNGPRNSRFFEYTPYLHRLIFQGFATTAGLQYHFFDWEAQYLAGSPFRLHARFYYDKNQLVNYFGLGQRSLQSLSFGGQSFASYAAYSQRLLSVEPDGFTYWRYSKFSREKPGMYANLEYDLAGGLLRAVAGVSVARVNIADYSGQSLTFTQVDGVQKTAVQGQTLLQADCQAGRLAGCQGGWDNSLRLALVYDSRDYEPDPNQGVFAEVNAEIFSGLWGSTFSYNRLTAAVRWYAGLWPAKTDLVLAVQGVYNVQWGQVPFYAGNTFSTTRGNIEGLGGLRTLRGFRADRFTGPVSALGNLELRWTMFHFNLGSQHFALMLVPFLDLGSVFDSVAQTSLANWKPAAGSGLRLAWNQATVVMADFAFSSEGSSIYVNFDHIF